MLAIVLWFISLVLAIVPHTTRHSTVLKEVIGQIASKHKFGSLGLANEDNYNQAIAW